MARVFVSIGSNVEREKHIRLAIAMLREVYGSSLIASSVYESDPVGFSGARFYNLVVRFDAHDAPRAVARTLRAIEKRCGRMRSGPRFSARTLDLDLLLYDELVVRDGGLCLPRDEILEQAFVLKPLAEIAGNIKHPVVGKTYQELWAKCFPEKAKKKIWRVAFKVPANDAPRLTAP
jgi:2-amino-4-hydroxy-6-hydroxymethyldihydropteridine diphosphokinase